MVKGQLLYKNGDSYLGEIKLGGELSGQGVYKFANGSVYEGSFEKGQFQGRGKLVDQFNSITIICSFQQGKAKGSGKIIYEDQSIFEGEISQGLRNGKGKYVYATKQKQLQYIGEFKNDQYEGEGILKFKNGDLYKGFFKCSEMNGVGQLKTKDFCLVGEFKNSLPHGKAKLNYSNGQSYQGDFYLGKKQGYGLYTFPDGTIYKGNFVNDHREGAGQIIFPTGQLLQGKFTQDEPVQGVYRKQEWSIQGKLRDNQLQGYCTIKSNDTMISGDYNQGQKNGFIQIVKQNSTGKQVWYKSEFRNDREVQSSISYSGRF